MRTQVAAAVKRHCRSWAACALVSLGAIAAVCSLVISVEPVGIVARSPTLSSTPSAGAGYPLNSSSDSADDVGAPAGACSTPIRVPKVCARSRPHMHGCMALHSACGGGRSHAGMDPDVHPFARAGVGCRAHGSGSSVHGAAPCHALSGSLHLSADANQRGEHCCRPCVLVVTHL